MFSFWKPAALCLALDNPVPKVVLESLGKANLSTVATSEPSKPPAA